MKSEEGFSYLGEMKYLVFYGILSSSKYESNSASEIKYLLDLSEKDIDFLQE